jgi:uncharacterized protein (TIGR02646 family)
MRRLPRRPALPEQTATRLKAETDAILASPDRKKEAESRYKAARKAIWFKPVVEVLRKISGPGERCMFCSGSESSQVEHYRPQAVFPELAMTWKNYLWACGICNQSKSKRFPPKTGTGSRIIDPSSESAWKYFFIDEFGNLTPVWRKDLNAPDPRAITTIDVLSLDRDALQQTRQQRLVDMKARIEDCLTLFKTGNITKIELAARREQWLEQPFQPDVADYFLRGPGSAEQPFKDFLKAAGK